MVNRVDFDAMVGQISASLATATPEAMRAALETIRGELDRLIVAERPGYQGEEFREALCTDLKAVLAANGVSGGKVGEVGGSKNSFAAKMPGFDFEYLSLYAVKDDPRVRPADITYCPQIPDETYDVVISFAVLEHVARPVAAGHEITRILKPGGIAYHFAPFSFYYHKAPKDYWRLTPDSFEAMFPALAVLKAEFLAPGRRFNLVGPPDRPIGLDGGPLFAIDAFGGWRENWFVVYAGRKTEESVHALAERRTRQMFVDLVAMLVDAGVADERACELAQTLAAHIHIDEAGDPRRRRTPGRETMQAPQIRRLWRQKRPLDLLPTANRFALAGLLADLIPRG